MPLKNSQYDILMRAYNRRQLDNLHRQQQRVDELYVKSPRIKAIDDTIRTLLAGRARALASGQSQPSLKEQIQSLRGEQHELLKAMALPEDYMELHYHCADCRDTGYIDGVRCHCFRQAAVNLLYDQSHIKKILEYENFSAFSLDYYSKETNPATGHSDYEHMKDMLAYCMNFASSFGEQGGNILFTGNTGVGKTFLSNCIAKAVIEHFHSVVYLNATELFNIFSRGSFSYEEEAADEVDHYVLDSDLLIIDDLGTERANTFTVSKLFYCINERLVRGKGTIISTNLTPGEIRDIYSERVASRILSHYEILSLFGRDIRIIKKFGTQKEKKTNA